MQHEWTQGLSQGVKCTDRERQASYDLAQVVKNLPAALGEPEEDTGLISQFRKMSQSKKWQHAAVFLLENQSAERNLLGYKNHRGSTESQTQLSMQIMTTVLICRFEKMIQINLPTKQK